MIRFCVFSAARVTTGRGQFQISIGTSSDSATGQFGEHTRPRQMVEVVFVPEPFTQRRNIPAVVRTILSIPTFAFSTGDLNSSARLR
jgi:hypothetical protein